MEFKGIGNEFRQLSQYELFREWESNYHFDSVLEAPFDQATDGIDGNVFRCRHKASKVLEEPDNSFGMVWNFGFLQREPLLLWKMRKISKRYIAAFVPNCLNPGNIVHKIYHNIYGGACMHPESGDARFMSVDGLEELFIMAGINVVESGYIDMPPWPDTVVTIKQLIGVKEREVLRIPINVGRILPFEKVAVPKKILAHHCYVFGVK